MLHVAVKHFHHKRRKKLMAENANKGKFTRFTVAFCILGVLYMFMYSGLQNDQINIIQGYSAWDANATLTPLTIANVVAIVFSFIYGMLFSKIGPKKPLLVCQILAAVGVIGIVLANGMASVSGVEVGSQAANSDLVDGNYMLYACSLFLIRITVMCFQLSGFMLATNWFIKWRGRVLGVITLGSPLFSVIGTSVMNSLIATKMNNDYRPFYVGIAVVLVLLCVLTAIFINDKPEDVGCYPDGADHPPVSEGQGSEGEATLGEVLSNPKTWVMIINFGCFNFIINSCMSSMVLWFRTLAQNNMDTIATGAAAEQFAAMGGAEGIGPMFLFVGMAAKWLSVGAILGIPLSFLFGVIDDKLGTPVACVLLGLTELIPITGLLVQKAAVESTGACNVPMLILWGIGVACMTGGVPTMNPASVGFAFGRREYAKASSVVLTIQLVPMAFSAQIMANLIGAEGNLTAWYLCYAVVAVGILFCIPMFKWGDAMAADRQGNKAE